MDPVHEERIAPVYVGAGVEQVAHEEPGNKAAGQPEDVRVFRNAARGAQAQLKGEPEDRDIRYGLHEQPNPAQNGAAHGLVQVDHRKVHDLVAPLPVLLQYLTQCIEHMPPFKRAQGARRPRHFIAYE